MMQTSRLLQGLHPGLIPVFQIVEEPDELFLNLSERCSDIEIAVAESAGPFPDILKHLTVKSLGPVEIERGNGPGDPISPEIFS